MWKHIFRSSERFDCLNRPRSQLVRISKVPLYHENEVQNHSTGGRGWGWWDLMFKDIFRRSNTSKFTIIPSTQRWIMKHAKSGGPGSQKRIMVSVKLYPARTRYTTYHILHSGVLRLDQGIRYRLQITVSTTRLPRSYLSGYITTWRQPCTSRVPTIPPRIWIDLNQIINNLTRERFIKMFLNEHLGGCRGVP